jgi:RNA polymerase sigma-70 factor, ECF subfamily
MAITPAPPEEQALAASALGGDEGALGSLLAMHQQSAYNVAYRLLGSEADARDAVQEAFLLAVRAVRGDGSPPRETDRFGPWLRRVVANAALGQLRRRPSFRMVSVDETSKPPAAPDQTDPARAVERREVRGDVLQALLSLPDSQRAALTLREYQELPYDEIAVELGVTRGAVERLLFRARREFRAAYEGLATTERQVGCPEFTSLLSAAVDNELGTPAWQELKAHLDGCPRCRQELNGLRRTKKLYAAVPLLALPAAWDATSTAIAAAHSVGAGTAGTAGTGAGAAGTAGTAVGAASAGGTALSGVSSGSGLLGGLATATAAKAAAVAAAAGIGIAVVAVPLVQDSQPPASTPAPAAATATVAATVVPTTATATVAPATTPTTAASPVVPGKVPPPPPSSGSPAPATAATAQPGPTATR